MKKLIVISLLSIMLVGCGAEPNIETTEAPVETTEAPVETTEAPVETTEAPVETTEAPVETTEAPVETTEAPVETTEAPVETTEDINDLIDEHLREKEEYIKSLDVIEIDKTEAIDTFFTNSYGTSIVGTDNNVQLTYTESEVTPEIEAYVSSLEGNTLKDIMNKYDEATITLIYNDLYFIDMGSINVEFNLDNLTDRDKDKLNSEMNVRIKDAELVGYEALLDAKIANVKFNYYVVTIDLDKESVDKVINYDGSPRTFIEENKDSIEVEKAYIITP